MLYSTLKEKMQKVVRIKSYDDILLSTLISQLVYKDLPDTVETNFLEMYKLVEGVAGIWKRGEDEYVSCHVGFSGMPDANGIGKNCIVATDDGQTKEIKDWKNSEEVVIFFNNNIKSPDLSIGIFSDMLSEADFSMMTLVKDAKHSHVPVVKDEKQKKALEQVFEKVDKGQTAVFVDESILPNFNEDGKQGVYTLDITDPTLADKIQYLSKAHDDFFRWFYSLNGMNSQGSSKMAQQTVDEVNQDSAASMIIPYIRLREAEKSIERVNEIWGLNAEVSLSESWMSRHSTLDCEFAEEGDEVLEDKNIEETTEEVEDKKEGEDNGEA